jgi:hypothetical protein
MTGTPSRYASVPLALDEADPLADPSSNNNPNSNFVETSRATPVRSSNRAMPESRNKRAPASAARKRPGFDQTCLKTK